MEFSLKDLSYLIKSSKNIALTTHRNCDGDGLGSLLAVHHALKKMNKNSFPIVIDEISERYSFLNTKNIQVFEQMPSLPTDTDLVLVFDTNDERLVKPLIKKAEEEKIAVCYIDHHPILTKGPRPTRTSVIDTSAASTAEIVYKLIELLEVEMNPDIAQALYTSIIFDTQVFRFIKSSADPFLISAKLLDFIEDPSGIHKKLFANQSPQKIRYLGAALKKLKLFEDEKIAYLLLDYETRSNFNITDEETLDIVDFLSEIKDLKFAAVTRENKDGSFKLSLRGLDSCLDCLVIAEEFGGGGHIRAAGASVLGKDGQLIENMILGTVKKQLQQVGFLDKEAS